jgi:hypothetical protein
MTPHEWALTEVKRYGEADVPDCEQVVMLDESYVTMRVT